MPKENEKAQVNLNETLRLTVDVTVSYLSKNSLPAAEVPHFIQMIRDSPKQATIKRKNKRKPSIEASRVDQKINH